MTRFPHPTFGHPGEVSAPDVHLRRPVPLVVDLDAGFLVGLAEAAFDPNAVNVSRPGWDLIRLQRRFRGRVLALSAAPVDVASWAAGLLGLGNALITVPSGGAAKAQVVTAQMSVQGFDIMGDAQAVTTMAAGRRLWLIGRDETLKRRMLTAGRQLYLLNDSDRFPLAQLAVAGVSSWDTEADIHAAGWSGDLGEASA